MPATLSNLRDFYLLALGELLFVERMLSSQVIPQVLGEIASAPLAAALARHLEQTKEHVANVEQSFRCAGAETSSNQSAPFVALKDQHAQLAGSAVTPALADVVHAQAALRVEHFEIASYHALLAAARAPAPDAISLLQENLAAEEQARDELQELLPQLSAAAAGAGAQALT